MLGSIAAAQRRLAYALVAPATALIVVIYVLPIISVLFVSFTDYTLLSDAFGFVGFDNYVRMFKDKALLNALKNTFVYAAIFLPLTFTLGLLAALGVQAMQRSRSLLETIYFMPVASTLAAMSFVWAGLLDSQQGIVNGVLNAVGIPGINWFGSPDWVLVSLGLISVWSTVGFNMVLFLAGLSTIPQSIYDASAVDGADNPIDRFLTVTWPMLAPTTMFVVVTNSIGAFKLFDNVALLTQGGPARSSEVFLYLTYQEGFQAFDMGYASALSLLFLGIIFAFAAIQAFTADRHIQY